MNQQKICILSPGRCGSTLLLSSLSTHPNIKNNIIEPFCSSSFGFKSMHSFLYEKFNLKFEHANGFDKGSFEKIDVNLYLNKIFEQNNIIKILYHHLMYDNLNKSILRYIYQDPNIFIINLSRKNLLALLVSAILTVQPLFFNNYSNKAILDLQEHKSLLYQYIVWERLIDCIFASKMIKVYYEDLIADWNNVIKKILLAINLEPKQIKKIGSKTEYVIPNLLDRIENIEVLQQLQQEHFKFFICDESLEILF